MTGEIIEKQTGKVVAIIKAILPYGYAIAIGENVFTIVLDLNLMTNVEHSIKTCAKVVYSSHGWSKHTHKLNIKIEE